jgi:hypothetical protein
MGDIIYMSIMMITTTATATRKRTMMMIIIIIIADYNIAHKKVVFNLAVSLKHFPTSSIILNVVLILQFYYYYYYLLQLGFHPVAVVLTLVHTIQMDI